MSGFETLIDQIGSSSSYCASRSLCPDTMGSSPGIDARLLHEFTHTCRPPPKRQHKAVLRSWFTANGSRHCGLTCSSTGCDRRKWFPSGIRLPFEGLRPRIILCSAVEVRPSGQAVSQVHSRVLGEPERTA